MLLGSLVKQSTCTLQLLLGAPLKADLPTYILQLLLGSPLKFEGRVLNYDVVRKILYERIITFSPKMKNIYARNTFKGPLKSGAQSKCLACLPSNTPLYITLTMILYEKMKPIEHVLLNPICVL